MKRTKTKLISSMTVLIVCFAMLIGSTFAWFTDSASTGVNRIQAGNLDVEVTHKNATGVQESIEGKTELFKGNNGDKILWEPGAIAWETFTVKNVGSLAFKYNMGLSVASYSSVNDKSLLDVLKVAIIDNEPENRNDAISAFSTTTNVKDIKEAVREGSVTGLLFGENDSNHILSGESSQKRFTMIIYWEPGVNDNDYNMNNNLQGNTLDIDFKIQLTATQYTEEEDSFDNQYDKDAENDLDPVTTVKSAIAVRIVENGIVSFKALATPTTRTQPDYSTTSVTFQNTGGEESLYNDSNVQVDTTNTLFEISSQDPVEVASINVEATLNGFPVSRFENGNFAVIDTYISTGLNDVSVTYKDPNTNAVETWETGETEEQAKIYNASGTNYFYYNSGDGHLIFSTGHFSKFAVNGKGVAFAQSNNIDKAYVDYGNAAIDAKYKTVKLANDANLEKASEAAKTNDSGFVLPDNADENVLENWEAQVGTRYFATLPTAVNFAKDNETVILLKNVDLEETISINDDNEKRNITIDLRGNTINSSLSKVIEVSDGNGLKLVGGKIHHTDTGKAIYISGEKTSLYLNDMTIVSEYLSLLSESSNGIISIDNCNITSNYFGITQNGLYGGNTITVTNSTITDNSEESVGIYISGNKNIASQNLTVTDSVITGETAIEAKHTNVTVTGSTLNATQNNISYKESDNGSTTVGYCLAITSNGVNDLTTGYIKLEDNTYNPANPGCDVFNSSAVNGVNNGATIEGYENTHVLSPDKQMPVCRIQGTKTVYYSAYDLRNATSKTLYNKTVVIQSNEVLSNEIYISGKTFTLDLNGHSLTLEYGEGVAPNNGSVIYVAGKNSKLTITDSSELQIGSVYGSTESYTNKVTSAVRVGNNGKLIINGGNFYGRSEGTSCIFVKTSIAPSTAASVTINGGYFETSTPSNGTYFVLNHQDNTTTGCKITVNGGKFRNYNPGVTAVDPVNAKTGKIALGTGCTTISETVGSDTHYIVTK